MDRSCPSAEPLRDVAGSVVFVTVLLFLTFFARFIFSPLMPLLGEDIGITPGQAGTVFFFGPWASATWASTTPSLRGSSSRER